MGTSLIVFSRFPVPGRAKTRLIPVIGAENAAELQSRMTRHVVGRAWSHCAATGGRLVVSREGGARAATRAWLGPVDTVAQCGGDLGKRMRRAAAREFHRGASRVILLGADCPRQGFDEWRQAERALDNADVVFGPADDGGYYLLGLSRDELSPVFENLPWGTSQVLAVSMKRARQAGLKCATIRRLPDVDEAADIPDAEAALEAGRTVSVIIPTLNEAANLARLLPILTREHPLEVIVVDGGSTDDTLAVAEAHGSKVLTTPPGRGAQMNAGARSADGEFLLFLHADTLPPDGWKDVVLDALGRGGVAAGAFGFGLLESIPFGRFVEGMVALRCRIFSTPYGDQGLFVRRRLFDALGGFPEWPILEDLALVKRLAALGRIRVSPKKALTSSRQWTRGGTCRTFLRHQFILFGYLVGLPIGQLAALRMKDSASS